MSTTITGLPNATTPLSGTERVPMDQAGATKDATTQDIANLAPGTDLSYSASTRQLSSSTGADVTLPVAGADAGLMSAADKSKLDAIASGATANATDAQLRDRSTHTGTQSAGTITGLATVATTGAYADLSGRPTLGTAAATDTTAYATAAQGAKADTALQPEVLSGYVQTSDARLSDSREWSAATIDQAEAEAGTATTRRAFTAQRVFQAAAAWWAASAAKTKLDGIAAGATNTPFSDATPQAPGTAAAGGASSAARGDHVHPLPSLAALGAAASGAITSSGLTQSTARLLGRATAGTGAVEEITLGTGLSFAGTTLNAAGGSPGGSSSQLQWNNGGTFAGLSTSSIDGSGNLTLTGRLINSLNGAASAPPLSLTGTWFTGGTATTTKPHYLIEPAGTTSTAWSTSGTGLGINAPSGFAGNLLDLQVNGTSRFRVNQNGAIISTAPSSGPALVLGSWIEVTTGIYLGSNQPGIVSAAGGFSFQNWQGNNSVPVFFGPSTSGFPSFRTSGTALQCRLGDNSGFATIDAQHRLQGTAPASATSTGTAGDIRYDADYIYVCTAANTWKRAALSTW